MVSLQVVVAGARAGNLGRGSRVMLRGMQKPRSL
jgi:ABC-type transporter Mla subunit MlaD